MLRKNVPKLVVFDCDGVLVDGYVSIFVAKHLGFGDKLISLYKDLLSSRISFEQAMEKALRLFIGIKEGEVKDLLMRVPLMRGAEETIRIMKNKGIVVGIISTGASQYFLDILGEMFKLDFFVGTRVRIEDGVFVDIEHPIVNFENKGKILSEIASRYGIPLSECVAVGDDTSNIPLFKLVGMSIMFDSGCLERELLGLKLNIFEWTRLRLILWLAKRRVKKNAHYVVKSRNLMDILNIIGVIQS
ncbi:MAG: HAD family phosphatase [Nitrososphaerota archaeon]